MFLTSLIAFFFCIQMPLGSKRKSAIPGASPASSCAPTPTKKKKESALKIIHVVCEAEDLQGFTIHVNGYLERIITDPLFDRNRIENLEYMANTDIVPHVFQKFNRERGSPFKNSRNYPLKMLINLCQGEPVTKDQIGEWVNDTFLPAIQALKTLDGNALPTHDAEVDYSTVTAWSDILSDLSIERLHRSGWGVELRQDPEEPIPQFRTFVDTRADKAQTIYSLWQLGHLTAPAMFGCGFAENDLRGNDKTKFMAFLDEMNDVQNLNPHERQAQAPNGNVAVGGAAVGGVEERLAAEEQNVNNAGGGDLAAVAEEDVSNDDKENEVLLSDSDDDDDEIVVKRTPNKKRPNVSSDLLDSSSDESSVEKRPAKKNRVTRSTTKKTSSSIKLPDTPPSDDDSADEVTFG